MTGPGSNTGAAAAQAAFEQALTDAQSTLTRLADLRAKAERVAVTERSPDGSVTATVNASGVLTDLRITDKLSGQPGARIAEQVLVTMRRAQSRIAGTMSEVMRETVGDDKEVVDGVLAAYHDRFAEPVAPQRPASVEEMRIDAPLPEPAPMPAPVAVPRHARAPRTAADDEWENPDEPILQEI